MFVCTKESHFKGCNLSQPTTTEGCDGGVGGYDRASIWGERKRERLHPKVDSLYKRTSAPRLKLRISLSFFIKFGYQTRPVSDYLI